MGQVVGIDVGEARIGLAISDEGKKIAFPLAVIRRENKSYCINKIKKLLAERNIDTFVVGLPVRSNGQRGRECEEVVHYAETLKTHFPYKVILWDERYTTVIAEKALLEGDLKREKRREIIDEIAAQVLLQSYLDHLQHTQQ